MNPFISVPLGCRAVDLRERLVQGSHVRQETGASQKTCSCWLRRLERLERLERFELPWSGRSLLISGHDHPALVLGTFLFVTFQFPVGDFRCRANRYPPSQSIGREYILACRSEIPCA
jgi:hypothetical protein